MDKREWTVRWIKICHKLMLKLKLQYFDHLMRRADSFEKTPPAMSYSQAGCLWTHAGHGDGSERRGALSWHQLPIPHQSPALLIENPGKTNLFTEKTLAKENRPLGRKTAWLLFHLRSEMRYEAMFYFTLPETSQIKSSLAPGTE